MITMDDIERLLFSGGDVVGDDGKKIGGVGEVFLDAASGQPAWVTVKTGLFGTSESFVPLDGAHVRGQEIHVPFGKDTVKHAPRMETAGGHLSPQEERDLYRYYGLHDEPEEPADRLPDAGPERRDDTDEHLAAPVPAGHGRHARQDVAPDARDDDRDLRDVDLHPGTPPAPAANPTPAPDDGSMVRSEERLKVVGTERVPAERVRLRRYTVTENRAVTVPVTREEFRVEYEPAEQGATAELLDTDTVGTNRRDTAVDPDGSKHDAGTSRP